ncbi:MAG: class I SAM-dependent methyltransferase [Bacteroidetes bacterium]|nr:class I SAM-dependent methyltransferase [Bacteroidota bacterium]
MEFKDHFSGHAKRYAKHRPSYPEGMYKAIYQHVDQFGTAWDCGTGNGQVAIHLTERFGKVLASDASASQIEHAIPHEKVEYYVCKAEQTGFQDHCFDLVTVGQAIHWFDFDSFFEEVKRVTKPGGIFACWTYRFLTINHGLNVILEHFFSEIESYWPPERDHVEEQYATIPFPDSFKELEAPFMYIERSMLAEEVLNYLDTWSSVKNYKLQHNGKSPIDIIRQEFIAAYGGTEVFQTVRHPLVTKIFSV